MKVFLVRHGDADAEVPEGLGDEARALTAKARQAVSLHFAALADRVQGIDLVLTSPLVRAVQTAQILSATLRHDGQLKAHRSLLPDMPVGAIETVLREHTGKSLVLVGHQPSMGAMAAHLLGMQSFPKQVLPGTVVGLERADELPPEGMPAVAARLLFYSAPGQAILEAL
ncbi:MAG: phosphohistidine phosphatase SixA [Myxococcaceae bacterium]